MKRAEHWFGRIAGDLEISGSALPLVEVIGTNRVLIENHGGVSGYSQDCVRIKVRYGQICVCGCSLEISRMTSEQLVVCGTIREIKLIRRDH